MSAAREALIDARTQLVNSTHGYLRTRLARATKGKPATFPRRVRKALEAQPEGMPAFIERLLEVIEKLNEEIDKANDELHEVASKDETCTRLMSAPGVGPVTAIRFVGAVDQVDRFGNAHVLESYLGLTPGEHSSSNKVRRTGITKAGPPKVRWALVQACWCILRHRSDEPIARWALEITKRGGKRVAIIAMARKLAGILFAMWRDGTEYKPARAARLPEGPVA
jgi:transposase